MATREQIEFDFKRALNQAGQIDTIANNLSRLSRSEFQNTLQNLSVQWKGDNASLYLSKGSRLQGEMDKTAGALHSIAEDIRTIAKRLYEAEMAALAIAMDRTY